MFSFFLFELTNSIFVEWMPGVEYFDNPVPESKFITHNHSALSATSMWATHGIILLSRNLRQLSDMQCMPMTRGPIWVPKMLPPLQQSSLTDEFRCFSRQYLTISASDFHLESWAASWVSTVHRKTRRVRTNDTFSRPRGFGSTNPWNTVVDILLTNSWGP